MPKKILKVGVVGLGRIASLLEEDKLRYKPCTHAGAISNVDGLKIVACCDIDEERVEKFSKKWKVKKCYTDYKEMLANEEFDILTSAAWSYINHDIVVEACKNKSIKAIMCEKPLGVNIKQAENIVKQCKKHKKILMVNHERRFENKYRALKDAIKNKEFGEIKTVTGSVLTGIFNKISKKKYGGGPLLHDATHLIDMLIYLFGDVEFVKGHIKKGLSVENIAVAFMQFKNGVNAFIEAGGERKFFSFEMDISGSHGRVRIGNGVGEVYKVMPSKRYEGFKELERVEFFKYDSSINGHVLAYKELRDIVNGKKIKNQSSGDDALKTMRVISKIYKNELVRKRKK